MAPSAHTGNQGAAMKDILNVIPAQEGVRAIKQDEGKPFDLGPVHFRWKVRGEDSAHAYTMFELNLSSGGGVDLHSHPSPETFYVLEGEVTFFHITNGNQTALVCDEGTLKGEFGGVYIVNEQFTFQTANEVLAKGEADAVAFGNLCIPTPDLPRRSAESAPLTPLEPTTFYSHGPEGYIDQPSLEAVAAFLDKTQL